MKTDRRSFLRLFGASTAAVATVEGIETVSAPTAPAEFQSDQNFRGIAGSDWACRAIAFEVRPEVLYQRIDIDKNAMPGRFDVFSISLGMPTGDGYADYTVTNLQKPNCLPMPNAFQVRKLGVVFSPKSEPGLRSAFLDRYEMCFRVQQKTYWRAPLSFMFSVGEPERQRGFTTLPDKGLADIGEIPLILTDEITFHAELYGKPIHPCGRLKFWVVAEGLMARAIQ